MFETLLRIDIVLFFVIGLLGGAHCIGMCGPLVTMYSKQMDTDDVAAKKSRLSRPSGHLSVYEVRQHVLFNVGRTASYAILGDCSAFSAVSSSSRAGRSPPVQR